MCTSKLFPLNYLILIIQYSLCYWKFKVPSLQIVRFDFSVFAVEISCQFQIKSRGYGASHPNWVCSPFHLAPRMSLYARDCLIPYYYQIRFFFWVHSYCSHETRALNAAVRACRRVYCEYQGQLLWKALSSGGGRRGDSGDLTAAFEAEVSHESTLWYLFNVFCQYASSVGTCQDCD